MALTPAAHRQSTPAQRSQGHGMGFTLIEVMLVVAVVGVLATMAVATLPRLTRDLRLSRAAHVFAAVVREARGRAISNRSYVRITMGSGGNGSFTAEEKRCAVGSLSSSCTGTWTVLSSYNLGSGDYSGVTFTPAATVIFTPWGVMESGGGSYRFGQSVGLRTLTVAVTAQGFVDGPR